MTKKKEPKRSLLLEYEHNGKKEGWDEKIIEKAVDISITDPTKSFMFIEKMKSGNYRITWSKNFLMNNMELSNLKQIRMYRQNG